MNTNFVFCATESPAFMHGANSFLLFAVLIILGAAGGLIAKKMHLPALTGQIVTGIVIGASCLNIFGHTEQLMLGGVSEFAIMLIAVTVGTHLNFRKMHNSYKRVLQIALVEASLAFIFVFFAFQYFNPFNLDENTALAAHLLLASIACATSPASALHIIKEKQAKGLIVKTMIGVIAIDNFLCLGIFEIVKAIAKQQLDNQKTLLQVLLPGTVSFIIAVLVGSIVGYILHWFAEKLNQKHKTSHAKHLLGPTFFTLMLISIMLTQGLCAFINTNFPILSPSALMANMVMGIVLTNFSRHKDHILDQFETIEQAVFICFFTLAGMHLDLSSLNKDIAFAGGIYLLTMASGKYFGAFAAAAIGDSTRKIAKNIGSVLLVQAGISIALVLLINADPAFQSFSDSLTAMLLTCVVITELTGTILISKTLDKTGESGKNRTRVIEFLEEEYILPSLYANDKWEAIKELCYFMVSSHNLEIDPEELIRIVTKKEKDVPSGIGEGLAVPHAIIETDEDMGIRGVLALANPRISFDAPDGQKARLIVLVITPKAESNEKHLQVIAALAKILSDTQIREAVFKAKSAAEVHEIIDSEETETFNYFLNV